MHNCTWNFPNLRTMEFTIGTGNNGMHRSRTAVAVPFPHLKELILESYQKPVKNELTSENAAKLLLANRQLEYFESTLNKLLNTIKENESTLIQFQFDKRFKFVLNL